MEEKVAGARRLLYQAQRVMAVPANLDSYEWSLITSNLCSVHQALEECDRDYGMRAHFDEVLEELRDITDNFRRTEFLRSTRAERRHFPNLFSPGTP